MNYVLLVDDEPTILNGIRSFIPWDQYQCEVAAALTDGSSALEYIERHPVDIVIADIKMPGISGLELAKILSSRFPAIKTIILTGHSDFLYAQTAITYNVVDFIIKTNPLERLEAAVCKAVEALEDQRHRTLALADLSDRVEKYKDEVRRRFLRDMLLFHHPEKERPLHMQDLQIQMPGRFAIMACRIALRKKLDQPEAPVLSSAFDFISRAAQAIQADVVPLSPDTAAILVPLSTSATEDEEQHLQGFARSLQNLTYHVIPVEIYLGCSHPCEDMDRLASVYEETLQCIPRSKADAHTLYRPNRKDAVELITNPLVRTVVRHIHSHFPSPLTLESLASLVPVTPSYLSSTFSRVMGESVFTYLNRYRISQAQLLIARGDDKLYEVAEKCGFNDAAYFSKAFKKYTGLSPLEYRHIHGEGLQERLSVQDEP